MSAYHAALRIPVTARTPRGRWGSGSVIYGLPFGAYSLPSCLKRLRLSFRNVFGEFPFCGKKTFVSSVASSPSPSGDSVTPGAIIPFSRSFPAWILAVLCKTGGCFHTAYAGSVFSHLGGRPKWIRRTILCVFNYLIAETVPTSVSITERFYLGHVHIKQIRRLSFMNHGNEHFRKTCTFVGIASIVNNFYCAIDEPHLHKLDYLSFESTLTL